ncbi:MAG: helix-turn-helix domain-containing protein [Candidatus Aminicenantes bacterium]|nr:helix-turn-helix domain-containing protein [Candidatus Aminicenantes bacterium]NIM81505.1 helix-turn-helix domain-containing protein [Candidatus Aminicenantes bacterium]NIN20875.1 helix-turn-helix domain-containing protein [Candidatus Aminicenantes bacterium]NIN44696.1 helix-turn-helix domain-containing protein [Candidatus Aminicenantes bacterium]NIN87504.1 helix-turn-helix domain-containing protein [Candidatus Aminicenantes bacterium]
MSKENPEKTRLLENIGTRMRQLRKTLGFTQDTFASILKISKPAYVRYEYGKRFPPVHVIQFLYKKYKVDNNWVVTGEGEMFLKEEEDEDASPFAEIFKGIEIPPEYDELVELMQIPAIEQVILAKLIETKFLFKDEIEAFKAKRETGKQKKRTKKKTG